MEQLIERVKAILLTPQTEWPVIAREPGDVSVLFTRYVAILALIGPYLLNVDLPHGLVGDWLIDKLALRAS